MSAVPRRGAPPLHADVCRLANVLLCWIVRVPPSAPLRQRQRQRQVRLDGRRLHRLLLWHLPLVQCQLPRAAGRGRGHPHSHHHHQGSECARRPSVRGRTPILHGLRDRGIVELVRVTHACVCVCVCLLCVRLCVSVAWQHASMVIMPDMFVSPSSSCSWMSAHRVVVVKRLCCLPACLVSVVPPVPRCDKCSSECAKSRS